jgi:hypothetical protein
MPLQRTISFVDINDENQPENTNPPSLSPPTPDPPPAISLCSRRQMGDSLCGSGLFNSLSGSSSPAANQSSKSHHHSGTTPYYQCSLQHYRDRCQIEQAQRNGDVSSLSTAQSSAMLYSPAQPSETYTVKTPTFKPPVTMKSSPRRSSPLGPRQHSLPVGRPVFPPSARKPDLYRHVLKKSARQTKIGIRRTRNSLAGGVEKVI